MPRIAQDHLKRRRIRKDDRGIGRKKIAVTFKRFFTETDGFEMVEYGVMTAIIVGAVVVALISMMIVIGDTFAEVATLL